MLFFLYRRSRVAYYAVFDGHGGSRASSYASKWLHVHLAQKLPKGILDRFYNLPGLCFCNVTVWQLQKF